MNSVTRRINKAYIEQQKLVGWQKIKTVIIFATLPTYPFYYRQKTYDEIVKETGTPKFSQIARSLSANSALIRNSAIL